MSLFIPYYVSKKERINKLVFSGGSTKGISYIGIIKGLEEKNLFKDIKTFAGTSIGAIFSFLLTIGYDYYSLNSTIKSIDIENLCKINKMSSYGFDDGVNLVSMIKELMDKKNIKHDITFKELFKLTNKRLIITVTNLTLKKAEYLDYKRTPDMNVLIGLRMSFSVPIVFKPIIYNGCYYVDGGLVDNLPVGIFKNKDKCLCVYIDSEFVINSTVNYLMSLFDFIGSTKNIKEMKLKNIITLNITMSCTNFKFNIDEINKLVDYGYSMFNEWYNGNK